MVDRRMVVGVVGAVGMMLIVQLLALALIHPFEAAGYEAVDDAANPVYGAVLFAAIIIATAAMLLALKYDFQAVIRWGIIGVAGLLTWYVIAAISPRIFLVGVDSVGIDPIPFIAALAVVVALVWYPEWYVIDASALIIGGGAAALFGISFSLLPIVLLLVVLAVYDAISVYGTKHMLTLAEGAMSMRLPVLVIIPMSAAFSSRSMNEQLEQAPDEEVGDPEMDALFLGLGDLVIPSIFIVSVTSAELSDPIITAGAVAIDLPVIGAIIGSLAGLIVLIAMVLRGRAHAGLPLLNGGVLLGYLVAVLAVGVDLATAVGL